MHIGPVKKIVFLVLLLIMRFSAIAQQCYDWEEMLGYSKVILRNGARDRFGNTYVTGSLMEHDLTINSVTIPFQQDFAHSAFILKYDSQNNLLWGRSLKGAIPGAIEIDHDSNVIIAGEFNGPTDIFDCFTIFNNGDRTNAFVMKMDSESNILWGTQTYGFTHEHINDIKITPANDIVIAGSYIGNDVTLQNKHFNGHSNYDSFIASISTQGTLQWAMEISDVDNRRIYGDDVVESLAIDHDSNVIFTGSFSSSQLKIQNTIIPAQGTSTYFVAKLDKTGQLMWAKSNNTLSPCYGLNVTVDSKDQIYVAGAFQDNSTFDQVTLTSHGLDDIFLIKYDINGNVITAKNFGGESFEWPSGLVTTNSDEVVVTGRMLSEEITMDTFTLSRDSTSDAFISTLDNNLNTTCLIYSTGDGYKGPYQLKKDHLDNIMLFFENHSGTANLGNKFSFYSPYNTGLSTVVLFLGTNQSYDVPAQSNLSINLGDDVTLKCRNEKISLKAGEWCNAQYLWSTGSTQNEIETNTPGLYWVEVKQNNKTARDTIDIKLEFFRPLEVHLDKEKTICPDDHLLIDVTQNENAQYLWSDDDTNSIKDLNTSGLFWIKVSNQCETVYDSISIHIAPPLGTINLGSDRSICAFENLILDATTAGAIQYLWQDGSSDPRLRVIGSSDYEVTVSNECETKTESVHINVIDINIETIPNVIIPDENELNDFFTLPENLLGSNLTIYNRWGEIVFDESNYQNNWNAAGLSSGIYYYTLEGNCLNKLLKGWIHVITE